jgi:hypothetical protein
LHWSFERKVAYGVGSMLWAWYYTAWYVLLFSKLFSITQKIAIKKMKMQATREFLSELKVLTSVHHWNLVYLST